MYLKRINKS